MAGGLTNLSKMPACNIMLLGAQRKTLSGFSSTSVLPHTGYIYHSDIVQSLPPVSPTPSEPYAVPQRAPPPAAPRVPGVRTLEGGPHGVYEQGRWSSQARLEF